ncbi:hypothetical protein [uncultured Mediterranean phage uvDeep-CGR2-KM19-C269]|nr:hypothetical protein [uncultured Mediterranean phage uvDeep-CGR2-KM19-C269]
MTKYNKYNYEIQRTLSKSGKRTMYYPTIEGKRLNRTNFAKKWEAGNFGKYATAVVNLRYEQKLEKLNK